MPSPLSRSVLSPRERTCTCLSVYVARTCERSGHHARVYTTAANARAGSTGPRRTDLRPRTLDETWKYSTLRVRWWKQETVNPEHNSGADSSAARFRPISWTSALRVPLFLHKLTTHVWVVTLHSWQRGRLVSRHNVFAPWLSSVHLKALPGSHNDAYTCILHCRQFLSCLKHFRGCSLRAELIGNPRDTLLCISWLSLVLKIRRSSSKTTTDSS